MITIKQEACIGCLTCVAVCPFTVLAVVDGMPRQNPQKNCLNCMHCAAACPQKAILCDGAEAIVDLPLPKSPENFTDALESHLMTRRSYRHFKKQPIPEKILSHAFGLSDWAPSAKNQHPAKWIVMKNKDRIDEIMALILAYCKETSVAPEIVSEYAIGNNVVMGTAPTLILAYASSKSINPTVDTALALFTIELILQAQGIGTCWAGYLTRMCNVVPALIDMLHLPEDHQIYSALMVGYPENEEYLHIPERFKKADVTWL